NLFAYMYQPPRWYVPAANPCQVVLGCRAMPTRCKYVPVSSRFSSLKTDGRHNPAPPARLHTPSRWKKNHQQLPSFCRCAGTPLTRPFDVRDDINEPPGTGSRRVVAGAYQRRGLHNPASICCSNRLHPQTLIFSRHPSKLLNCRFCLNRNIHLSIFNTLILLSAHLHTCLGFRSSWGNLPA